MSRLMPSSMGWPILITFSAIGLLLASGTASPLRTALAFWFLLVCPGMAFVRLLRLKNWIIELSLAVALSLAVNTLISEVAILAGIWSVWGILLAVISVTMLGVLLQIIQTHHYQWSLDGN